MEFSEPFKALCLAISLFLHCFASIPCLGQGTYHIPPEREHFNTSSSSPFIFLFSPSDKSVKALLGNTKPFKECLTFPTTAEWELVLVHTTTTTIYISRDLAESGFTMATCSKQLLMSFTEV